MSQASGFPQTSPGQFQPAYPQAPQQFQHTPQAQPAYAQAPPGQQFQQTPQAQPGQYYVQPGHPTQAMGQQAQPGQRPNQGRSTTPITTAYWQSAFIADKLVEFVSTVPFASDIKPGHPFILIIEKITNRLKYIEQFILLAAWICIVRYSDRFFKVDGKANFFKGITVFCWVMVILFEIAFVFVSSNTRRFFSKPRDFTIICLVVQIILTILLIACSVNLVPLAHNNTKVYDFLNESGKTRLVTLYLALIFAFFACLCFLDDIRSLYKMIGTLKAEAEQAAITEQQQVVGSFAQSVPVEPVPVESGLNSQM